MSYGDLTTHDIRLCILILLLQQPGYEANEYVLQGGLEEFGHHLSQDRVRTELCWLKEQQLLNIRESMDLQIAVMSQRGADVATAKVTVPGVKRPRPRG